MKQGLIQAFGVLTDTSSFVLALPLLFCFLMHINNRLNGIALTQAALSEHIGSWASGCLAIFVFIWIWCVNWQLLLW